MFDIEFKTEDKFEIDISDKVTEIAPPLVDLEVTPIKEQQEFNHEGEYGYDKVIVKGINLQDKTVTPTKEEQVIKADEGFSGLNKVTINAPQLQSKEITPTSETQTIVADDNFIGLDEVVIKGDSDLKPENIKEGVDIFGVTGTAKTQGYEYAEFDPYNVVEVLDNDTEPYENKFILLLTDIGNNQYVVRQNNKYFYYADKIKGSDGQEMAVEYASKTYTFDTTKDLINSFGQRVRYFIVYLKQRQFGLYGNDAPFQNEVLMSYFKNCEMVESGNTYLGSKPITKVIKFDENCSLYLRSSNIVSGYTIEEYIMPNKVSFEKTSPNLSYSFYNASNLKKARINLANIITDISYCVGYDYALKEVEFINCPNEVINTSNLFQNDYSLEKIVATPILKPSSDSYMFGSLNNLKCLSGIDFGEFTSSVSLSLRNLAIIENVKNINVNFSVSSATQLTHDSIINIMNALVDLTGQTAKTLTLGTNNINKITDEEKAIAINKNWNIA